MVERRKSKVGRRELDAHECPVENCGEVSELIIQNKVLSGKNTTLSKRVTYIGSVSLVVLSLVVTVLLALANQTLNIAQNSAENLKSFAVKHNLQMLSDEKVHTSTMEQLSTLHKQMELVSKIQRDVVQEVSILKSQKTSDH